MPQHVTQFAVTVRDYDDALAFYVGKLGFECVEDNVYGNLFDLIERKRGV